MIAYLEGKVLPGENSVIILTAGGVGYRVYLGPACQASLKAEEKAALYIYSHIREDRFELYGFSSATDLNLCEILLSVSGCGPKMAQAMIDVGAARVIKAVQNAEVSFFTSIPRVGKTLAQKIIIDLKKKLGGVKDLDLSPKSSQYQDALAGLQALGFSDAEIETALSEIEVEKLSLEEVIKQGIKNATRR